MNIIFIEKILGVFLFILLLVLGVLIRKKIIPPISTGYLMASKKERERLRQDPKEISFMSNIFFMMSACFAPTLLGIFFFPDIEAFYYLTVIFILLLLIYVIYKSIAHEIHKDK